MGRHWRQVPSQSGKRFSTVQDCLGFKSLIIFYSAHQYLKCQHHHLDILYNLLLRFIIFFMFLSVRSRFSRRLKLCLSTKLNICLVDFIFLFQAEILDHRCQHVARWIVQVFFKRGVISFLNLAYLSE